MTSLTDPIFTDDTKARNHFAAIRWPMDLFARLAVWSIRQRFSRAKATARASTSATLAVSRLRSRLALSWKAAKSPYQSGRSPSI